MLRIYFNCYFIQFFFNAYFQVAILNQHSSLIEILLKQPNIDLKIKNTTGQTPFATALMRKNNNATSLILKKEPNAAEQVSLPKHLPLVEWKSYVINIKKKIILRPITKVEIFFTWLS